jgi:phosphatidylserine/phosphatidylglycerophosphate/cardiolipin synthase-like enzyme
VRGLFWRSHWDRLAFSAQENRHMGEQVNAAGGCCLLDMRVRMGGSHHQKFVVLRHRDRVDLDVAFVGGIDLCHGRRDDARHEGDPQPARISAAYGARPPWHDVQAEIRGPAVAEAETVFRERWDDPSPLTRNPVRRLRGLIDRDDAHATPLPAPLPAPEPWGPHAVQLLRTYPLRRGGYPFAPRGERSIARGYIKALQRARTLIYLEDQYLWSREVAQPFAEALAADPELRMIAVIPHEPAEEGRVAAAAVDAGRGEALRLLHEAGGDRFAVYGLENHAGTPVYVHAKVVVVDDVWASIGSDNVNLRSWTHDSELSCVVLDETLDRRGRTAGSAPADVDHPRTYARDLRLRLAREHLDRADGDDADLCDPVEAFEAFAKSAAALEAWHADGCRGPRPPGRIRRYRVTSPESTPETSRWARLVYRRVFDPDGRPRAFRRAGTF